MESVTIDKKTIFDLVKLKEEFELIIESIELMSEPKVMNSLKKSEEQIKNRKFADWNEL